jgi:small neutral amino acid transporter SnatA (MarC family)
MVEEYEKNRRRQVSSMRSVMDFLMGIVFFGIGGFFFYAFFTGRQIMDRKPTGLDLGLGALFVIYGVWRIYRGYKKNYFRD